MWIDVEPSTQSLVYLFSREFCCSLGREAFLERVIGKDFARPVFGAIESIGLAAFNQCEAKETKYLSCVFENCGVIDLNGLLELSGSWVIEIELHDDLQERMRNDTFEIAPSFPHIQEDLMPSFHKWITFPAHDKVVDNLRAVPNWYRYLIRRSWVLQLIPSQTIQTS